MSSYTPLYTPSALAERNEVEKRAARSVRMAAETAAETAAEKREIQYDEYGDLITPPRSAEQEEEDTANWKKKTQTYILANLTQEINRVIEIYKLEGKTNKIYTDAMDALKNAVANDDASPEQRAAVMAAERSVVAMEEAKAAQSTKNRPLKKVSCESGGTRKNRKRTKKHKKKRGKKTRRHRSKRYKR
jgi:hypothetical protein